VTPDSEARTGSGFFNKLKARLNQGKAWIAHDVLRHGGGRLDAQTLETLEEQLLIADVGIEATRWLLERMQKRPADGRTTVLARLEATMLELLDPLEAPLAISPAHKPFVVLAIGVNGTGKTTTLGKLANRLRAQRKSVLLAAADTFRAAAVEQLQEWGRRASVPVVSQAAGADPAAVVHDALESARARGIDVVLADTAGRLHTASGLMDELEKIKRVAQRFDPTAPHEVLLVLDASQGQNALAQAVQFNERLGVTGLVITKLDGTAKGGVVLGIALKLGLPIRYIAIGEGSEDFAEFRAAEFTRALLGSESL
jgi:fused signal recognition particle receptor